MDSIFDLKHGVFNRFFELRNKNDSENRQHKDYIKPENINAMHNLFQMLSFRLFENNFGDINREIYTDVLTANIKDESGNKYELPEDIMEVILSYPIDDNDEYINFAHRSIGEYFMAIRIISAMKVIYGRKSFSGMQADELKHYIDDFVRRMTALLRKGTVSGNESMVHYFLKQMLSKEYSASARSAFHQNLSDMDFLSRAFSRMLEAGFTNYTIDEASNNVYVDINETAEKLNFEKKREQELNCFRNVIDLIQIVRNVVNGSKEASEDRLLVTEEASDDRLFVTEAIAEGDAFKKNFEYYVSQSDFSVMNLSGFRLLKLDMSLYDLSKGIFRDAVFKDCDLTGANLEFADLRGARIIGCNLTGTRLGGCRGDIHSIRNEDNNNLITASTDFTGACKAVTSSGEIYVGGTFEFGRYPQNADGMDTDTPILWRVLDIVDGHALLLSDKILDAIPYHDEWEDTCWEKCDLNAWLNKRVNKYKNRKVASFYYDAFNSKEQSRIVNINSKDPRINSDTGREKGCEKIFLLSYEELLKYFDRRTEEQKGVRENEYWHSIGGEQAVAYCTDYVINKLDKVFAETSYLKDFYVRYYENIFKAKARDIWWLRSSGSASGDAMTVHNDGDVSTDGHTVNSAYVGVRPALWINLKS